MTSKVARPADLNLKQVPDENPYELSPVIFDPSEVDLEMKNNLKFTPLPQEPPPPPAPLPRPRVAETDISTGVSTEHDVESPQYKNPPPYRGRSGQGQHFYEEVRHQRQPGRGSMLKQMSRDSEYGSPTSLNQSHTEADQAILFSQSTTNSLAPLTDSVERKPRKKVNPLYDSYREGENGTADRQSELSISERGRKVSSKPGGPAGCFGSVLRHPCTTLFLFLLLVGLIVLFVLLLMGTISSKGGETSYQTQPANTSEEVVQLRQQVADQENLILSMMDKINSLEMAISSPGSENASVNAKIAHNTLLIMNLQQNVTKLDDQVQESTKKADLAYALSSQNIGTLAAYKNRIEVLEANSRQLNASVNTLSANLQTHSVDINILNMENDAQDNELTMLGSRISTVQQEFAMSLDAYNDTIFQELLTISKMQGPRGFNGSDGAPGSNLALCEYKTSSRGSGTSQAETVTSEIIAGSNEVITGATCSTTGGERAFLTTGQNNGIVCSCSGSYNAADGIRVCAIHYWKCPI